MAEGFKIQVQGLDKLGKVFKRLPKTVQKEINDEFRAIGEQWVARAKADAPVDRSRLKNAINFKTSDLTLEVGVQNEYAAYLEFGTKGKARAPESLKTYASQFQGSGTSKVDPIVALTAWVKRKGLNAVTYNVKTRKKSYKNKDAAAKSIAIAIFKKHQREGMAPKTFLFTSKTGQDRVAEYVSQVKTNITAVLKELVA